MHACINAFIQTLLNIDSSDESTAKVHIIKKSNGDGRNKKTNIRQNYLYFYSFFEWLVRLCVCVKYTTPTDEMPYVLLDFRSQYKICM